jgi:hypothetical protein
MYPPWIYSMTNRKLADTKTQRHVPDLLLELRREGQEEKTARRRRSNGNDETGFDVHVSLFPAFLNSISCLSRTSYVALQLL